MNSITKEQLEKDTDWNIDLGHQEQKDFLAAWPVGRIKNITLEEYTNLDKDTSLVYWLEKRTEHTGSIWGGSAFKFGIYRRRNTEELVEKEIYRTDGIYAWYSKYGETKEEAFGKIKAFVIKIVDASINEMFDEIDNIDWGDSLKWKLAFLYNPMKLVPIFKKEVLQRASESAGLKNTNKRPVSELQKYLINQKNSEVSTLEFAQIIWSQFNLDNFYYVVDKFLEQAQTDNLKQKGFPSSYKGYKVRVSFGAGNVARIPWIAFLDEFNSVQDGIYPVYLYYKSIQRLFLAYGISETKLPERDWNIENPITIGQYFSENSLGKPERYGSSYVFKVYDVNDKLESIEMDHDLNSLLSIYKGSMEEDSHQPQRSMNFSPSVFIDQLVNSGLYYDRSLVIRFLSSLLTKPFVILTGLSGSGKTKLALSFVQWICKDKDQYRIIPVGADWTNREPLLGFPNAIKPEEYVKPDTGVLDLMMKAASNADLPHFLILDEMNLSHVERYFADFLSVMETKEEILLHSDGRVENGVPAKLNFPSNLFIIGTVNIDETTNMFSPKVLDRANTIEFRVTKEEMRNFLDNIRDINMDALIGRGAGMAKSFQVMAFGKKLASKDIGSINDALVQFFSELKKSGAEFGYRSATEIMRLIHQLSVMDSELTTNQKIDIAIMQKLLPKLHGSRRKLSTVLETLGSFCISGDIKINEVFGNTDFDYNSSEVLYPLSLEKIVRMYRGALDNGFTSFAEA